LSKKLDGMDVAGDLAAATAADELGARGEEPPPLPSPVPVPVPIPVPSAGPEATHRPPPAIGEGIGVCEGEGVEVKVAERVVSAYDPFVEVAVVYGEEEDDKEEEGEEDERPVAGGVVSVSYSLFRGQAWAQAQTQATVNSGEERCSQELLQRLPAKEDQWSDDDHIALYCIADAADEVRERGQ
jgi:hypothetical protein